MSTGNKIKELEGARRTLLSEVESIQADLGNKRVRKPNGQIMSGPEWKEWRQVQQALLNKKLGDLRVLNAEIQSHRKRPAGLAVQHLQKMLSIIDTFDDLDAEELVAIKSARTYVRQHS